jgi:hypothetical protein
MKQALHIFRKDARRFAYQICALAALTLVWAWANLPGPRWESRFTNYRGLAGAALIIGWWYLISLLIHEEPLTGDRQFWVTRPYSRRSLVAAKSLFILAFFNLPLLLAGFAIVAAAGYPPLAYLPDFLWMQLTFTAAVLLLPAALAALTRTLVQFALTVLGLFAGLTLLNVLFATTTQGVYQSRGLLWAVGITLLLLSGAPTLLVLVLQLRTRNRLLSAAMGAALVVLMLYTNTGMSRQLGIAVQSRMFPQNAAASATAVLSADGMQPDPKHSDPDGVTVAVPLRVVNIPAGETAAPDLVDLTFETPAGRRWSSGWIQAASTEADVFQVDPSPDGAFAWRQRVVVDRAFWQRARSGAVSIRGDAYVMLFGRRDVPIAGEDVTPVPGDGRCSISQAGSAASWLVRCLAPFHMPFTKVEDQTGTPPTQNGRLPTRILSIWDSPLPADFGMNPLSEGVAASAGQALFLRYEPRTYLHRSFSAASVRPAP